MAAERAGIGVADRRGRRRLPLRDELLLALLPTLIVLAMLALLEAFSAQRLLFASLASTAFLIYLAPLHATNTARTLVTSQAVAVGSAMLAFLVFGHGYRAAGVAMVGAILLMVVLGATHPPAVATSLTFALRSGSETEVALFGMALGLVVCLVLLQRAATRLLARYDPPPAAAGASPHVDAMPPAVGRRP